MGYYTNFKLTLIDTTTENDVSPNSITYMKIREIFNDIFGVENDDDFDYLVEEGCVWKWYSWEEDMKKIAKLFPDVFFELKGEGEDRGDWWIANFMGNKFCVRQAEIIPPENHELIWKED